MGKIFSSIVNKMYIASNADKNAEKIWEYRNKALNRKGLSKLFFSYKYKTSLEKRQAYIPLNTIFAGAPVFPHGVGGVYISSGAKIGDGCTIFQQVTIGSNTLNNSKGCGVPTIGNNCYIGAGAKIIGSVVIGDNVRIGANCIVTEDIKSNTTVVMQRPRIIKHTETTDNSFVSFNNNIIVNKEEHNDK